MTITSTDINNQRFSIDRKGYDVDEVDVFLEFVADELDKMNAIIAQYEGSGDTGAFPPVSATSGFQVEGEYGDQAGYAADQQALINELDARLADQEALLAERESALSEQQSNLAEQAAIISELEKQLDAALAQAAEVENAPQGPTQEDLDARDGRIAELEAQITAMETASAAVQDDSAARIAALNDKIAAMESASAEEQGDNTARIAVLNEKIAAMESAAAAVKVDLGMRIGRIAELEEKVSIMEKAAVAYAEKDAEIEDLRKQIDASKDESRAISQALVVAQQSATEIVDKSKRDAEDIVDRAKQEAEEIRQRAQEEKQKIIDSTADYREKRNDAQEEFRVTLEEIIESANSKLSTLTSDIERRVQAEREMRRDASASATPTYQASPVAAPMWQNADVNRYGMPQQAPIMPAPSGYPMYQNYVTPIGDTVAVNPLQIAQAGVEKDMSGYGDTVVYDYDDVD